MKKSPSLSGSETVTHRQLSNRHALLAILLVSIPSIPSVSLAQSANNNGDKIVTAFLDENDSLIEREPSIKEQVGGAANSSEKKRILMGAIEKRPKGVIRAFPKYENELFAGEILEILVKISPKNLCKYLSLYSDHPSAEAVIEKAAAESPVACLENGRRIGKLNNGKKVLKAAITQAPEAALANADELDDFDYAAELLHKPAIDHPEVAVMHAWDQLSSTTKDIIKAKLGARLMRLLPK